MEQTEGDQPSTEEHPEQESAPPPESGPEHEGGADHGHEAPPPPEQPPADDSPHLTHETEQSSALNVNRSAVTDSPTAEPPQPSPGPEVHQAHEQLPHIGEGVVVAPDPAVHGTTDPTIPGPEHRASQMNQPRSSQQHVPAAVDGTPRSSVHHAVEPTHEAAEEGPEEEERVDNFESESFDQINFVKKHLLRSLKSLQLYIMETDQFTQDQPEFLQTLNNKVDHMNKDMELLKNYCDESRKELEEVRLPIKEMTDRIFRRIALEDTDETTPKSAETCELDVREKKLKVQLTRVNDDLLKLAKISAETEAASLEAQIACAAAVDLARHIQAELEEKRQSKLEELKRLEAERLADEARRAEEERLQHAQDLLDLEMARLREQEAYLWPIFALKIQSQTEFDYGIGCVVKADPEFLRSGDLNCEVIDIVTARYTFADDEELISNCIRVYMDDCPCNDSGAVLKSNMCFSIPHCLPRSQASIREPVIKLEEHGYWSELKTRDSTVDGFRSINFAQAEICFLGKFLVVSRFKKDHVRIKKKGGHAVSKVDPRLTFTVSKGTFIKPEKIRVQVKQIDQISMNELKRMMPMAKNLMTSSSIFQMEWINTVFGNPVHVTIPIPPNPVSMRKAEAAKAAKEGKAKPAGEHDEDAPKEDAGLMALPAATKLDRTTKKEKHKKDPAKTGLEHDDHEKDDKGKGKKERKMAKTGKGKMLRDRNMKKRKAKVAREERERKKRLPVSRINRSSGTWASMPMPVTPREKFCSCSARRKCVGQLSRSTSTP